MIFVKDFGARKLKQTETNPHQKWSTDESEGDSCSQVHTIGEMTEFFISNLSDLGHEGLFPGIKFKHLEIQSCHQ